MVFLKPIFLYFILSTVHIKDFEVLKKFLKALGKTLHLYLKTKMKDKRKWKYLV